MRVYTGNYRYLKIMLAGAERIDLQGNPSGDAVTEAQAATAQERLAAQKANRKEKRKAQKAAKKEQAQKIAATAEETTLPPAQNKNKQGKTSKSAAKISTSTLTPTSANNTTQNQEKSTLTKGVKLADTPEGRKMLSLKKKTKVTATTPT